MPTDSTRQVVVDALDELGEQDRLSYAQRTASDEPYPPSVVEERLEAIRRGLWEAWGGVGLTGLIALLVTLGVFLNWGMTDFLAGVLPGMLVVGGISVRRLRYYAKAEQLYGLLPGWEDETETKVVSESPVAEVA